MVNFKNFKKNPVKFGKCLDFVEAKIRKKNLY